MTGDSLQVRLGGKHKGSEDLDGGASRGCTEPKAPSEGRLLSVFCARHAEAGAA